MTISEPDNLDAIWDTRFRDPLNKFLDEFMDHSRRVFFNWSGIQQMRWAAADGRTYEEGAG